MLCSHEVFTNQSYHACIRSEKKIINQIRCMHDCRSDACRQPVDIDARCRDFIKELIFCWHVQFLAEGPLLATTLSWTRRLMIACETGGLSSSFSTASNHSRTLSRALASSGTAPQGLWKDRHRLERYIRVKFYPNRPRYQSQQAGTTTLWLGP